MEFNKGHSVNAPSPIEVRDRGRQTDFRDMQLFKAFGDGRREDEVNNAGATLKSEKQVSVKPSGWRQDNMPQFNAIHEYSESKLRNFDLNSVRS